MEKMSIKKSVFLIGFMGVGKSSIALELSRLLSVKRVEMDEFIVQQEGMSIPELFRVHGEEYFRTVESAAVVTLSQREPMVISCGGGVPLREENVRNMRQRGIVVQLTARPETVFERVRHDENRPLLKGNMNVGYITELMAQRQPHYDRAADFSVSTDGKSVSEICHEIEAKLPANEM